MSYLKYDGTAATETAAPSTNFFGTAGSDTDNGTAANEGFWGQGGDLMTGGAGDDTYYLQDKADVVVEQPGGGTDELVAWANTSLANYANVENLSISGDGIYGAGNSADNIIYAGAGTEQIYGGGGQDVLVGGTGTDTFIVKAGEGNDAIYGFKPSTDVIRLSAGFSTFADLQSHMTQVGADVKIDFGGGEGMVIRNTQVGQLTAANFELGLDTSKLGGMTFHDEFSGPLSVWNPTYNPTGTWRPDFGYQGTQGVGSYTLTGNGEQQIYTSQYFRDAAGDHASPFTSNPDGTLSITAAPAPAGETDLFGYQYTSGMISTKESFAQTYGYFEMRAELPHSAGGWPAFWLVPADGSWPPELDVMETLTGDPNADYTTQHSQATGTHIATGISSYIPNTSDGFHTYGVLWTKTDLVWYVDGVEVFHTATPADMNKPMYMIANLALGGWSGTIDPATMPETMKIDYIRSFALADGSTTVQGFDSGQTHNEPFSTTISPPADSTDTTTPPPPPPPPASPPPASPPPASPPPVSPPPVTASPPPVSPPATSSGAGQAISATGIGNTLTGTDGADTLTSHQGGDTMTGGAGDDLFVFAQTPWTPDHITDFQVGHDKLDISALYVDGYHGTDPIADGYVTLVSDGHGGTSVIVDPDGPATAHQWGDFVVDLQGVDPSLLNSANLFGTGAATVSPPAAVSPPPVAVSPPPVAVSPPPVTASPPPASPPPVSGGGGGTTTTVAGSVLTGHAGGDTLTGSTGSDTLTGLDGSNMLHGGDGNDSISGGSGFNSVNGNKGDDTIAGHSTVGDWLLGGQGNDMISASGQHNILNGNLGNDTVVGGAGNDILHGGQGDDSMVAGSGSEWISGDLGNDTIQLGSGSYTIHDFNGGGIDTVFGFNASDHVQLDAGTQYTVSQSGADTIIDLQGGDELILKNVQLSSLPTGWVFTG